MVKQFYTPADKRLPSSLASISKSVRDVQRPTGTEKERSILKLQNAIDTLNVTVAELSARSSHQASPADLTLVYGKGYGQKGPATRDFSLPGPSSGRRTALLVGSGNFEWAGGSSGSQISQGIYLRLELRMGNTLLGVDTAQVSANPFEPASFSGEDATFVTSIRVPANTSPSFQLRLFGFRSADGGETTDAGRVANMSFTIQYGDLY